MTEFRCIECGQSAEELYKDYQVGVIKISHCSNCGCVVDKYIEYEPMVIFLDTVLHKTQAYRHVLYNAGIHNRAWKLALIYVLCDTYLRWDQRYSHRQTEQQMDEHIFYAALEYQFYTCFLIASIELCVFLLLVVLYVSLKERNLNSKSMSSHSRVTQAIMLSSYSKLLAIPAIIWGQTHSSICLVLTQLFLVTSNAAALNAVTSLKWWEAVLVLSTATTAHVYVGNHLTTVLLGS